MTKKELLEQISILKHNIACKDLMLTISATYGMKVYEELKETKEKILNVFIECDELGLEPTIPTHEDGTQIVNRWRKHLKVGEKI